MKKGLKTLFIKTVVAGLLLIGPSIRGVASEADRMPALDSEKEGKLAAVLVSGEAEETMIPVSGETLKLYKVAELTVDGGSAEYTLSDPFLESGITFQGMEELESNEAAREFAKLAKEKHQEAQIKVTNQTGEAVFFGLTPGMYLVMQEEHGLTQVKMDPYLVAVPMAENINGKKEWNYEVITLPKTEVQKVEEPLTETERMSENFEQTDKLDTVKTGDDSKVEKYLLLSAAALLVLTTFRKKKRI